MRRFGLRTRIAGLLVFFSVVPPSGAVWYVRARVRDLVRTDDERRIDEALAEFEAAIGREGKDVQDALERVALLVLRNPLPLKSAAGAGQGKGVSFPADYATWLMEAGGLDCLALLDRDGRILISGHAPGSAGLSDPVRASLPEAAAAIVEDEIAPGVGRALTLQSRRALELPGLAAYLVGGRLLDSDFLERLSPGGTVRAVLLDRQAEILAASQPEDPLPSPDGRSTGPLMVRGVPHSYRTRTLVDATGSPIGSLVAAVSMERFLHLSSSLSRIALAVAAAGAATSLLVGLGLARAVTRPLLRLEEMSRLIARDRYEPIGLEAPGEIGDLARAFDRMANSLRESREKLRQAERLAAGEEVARRVAHEIKNPLSPIALTLEGLVRTKRSRPQEFDAAFEEAIRTIKEEVQRMRHILEDFSRFGRLPEPRPRPTDLNDLIRGILPLFAENSASARLVADLDRDLPPVHVDPDRMSEVINNLVANALQAIDSPGGTVTISTRSGSGMALLLVCDTGPGLTEEARLRLFEPYFSTRPGGTGLGLAIARRIVLDHGGTIDAGNRDTGGAEIRIGLPLTPPGSPFSERAPAGGMAWRRS
jgi:signal transduction histidine kinase